jgi:hypothetical protein
MPTTIMGPEMIALSIVNWILGLLGLLCVLILVVCPLGTVISAIVEGSKQLAPGERRSWKKTKIFGILSGVGLVGLIIILVLWSIAVYVTGI